jgi:predicted 3-demethylubiquinone-9 3-methyltransferase (glyoxalase superfamily)
MAPNNIVPMLMFEGKAEEAMRFYTSVFPNAAITSVERYGAGEGGPEGSVKVAEFQLLGRTFRCIDSPVKHGFTFTPAISFVVDCESSDAVDRFFAQLSEGGQVFMPVGEYPFSKRFAWVGDRYGVSWQLKFQ